MAPGTNPTDDRHQPAAPRRELGLLDSICIIVGIIIGSSLYESSPSIAQAVPGPSWLVGVWMLGGLLSLIGALCYVELATTFPSEGGDYVYLTRAFGRTVGFLFAWAQLWVVRPGSIGAMAFVFARYAQQLCPLGEGSRGRIAYAAAAIVGLTAVNLAGVRLGKWTQNLLTLAKILGLAVVVAVGFSLAGPSEVPAAPASRGGSDVFLAMILVLYAFGGWNEMAYVAAEVRHPHKNILRALVLGTLLVTAVYLLVTGALLHALGFAGVRGAEAVAADVLHLGLGAWGSRFISLLVCVSALGAINGMIFTGARITYAMGCEHRLYAWLGQWNRQRGTPVRALIVQAAITLGLLIGFGRRQNGFSHLVNFTTPVFWIFFFLAGVSLFVLRWREPLTPRPYRVLGYPFTPLLFCASSLFMIYASESWAWHNRSYEALWAVGILGCGVVLSLYEFAHHDRG
jgi:amino acid transporter